MRPFVSALHRADVIRVDDGPILSSFDYDEAVEAVLFTWTDGEDEFSVEVDKAGIESAEHHSNGFLVTDVEGDVLKVEVFRLTPEYPVPPVFAEGWPPLFQMAADEGLITDGAIDDALAAILQDAGVWVGPSWPPKARIEAIFEAHRGRRDVVIERVSEEFAKHSIFSAQAWQEVLYRPLIRDSVCRALADANQSA